MGKTHLLHAIVNVWTARQPHRPPIEVGAGELVEQWVAAMKGDAEADLPRRLERSDLVVVDDLHLLSGRPVTQGEVARVLEATLHRGGRVVCAAGCSPAGLPVLTEALRRVPAAHFIAMRPPRGHDLRHILRVMAGAHNLSLPAGILADMADRCQGDVRRGEGELARRRFGQSHPLARGPLLAEKP